jgi:hypothetical protein
MNPAINFLHKYSLRSITMGLVKLQTVLFGVELNLLNRLEALGSELCDILGYYLGK